jgi:hypothetical protein
MASRQNGGSLQFPGNAQTRLMVPALFSVGRDVDARHKAGHAEQAAMPILLLSLKAVTL